MLLCEVCLNNFTSQQASLFVLLCSHPICEHCVKSICIDQSIVCPVCWKMTQLHTNSGSLLSSLNKNSLDGQTRASTIMLEESSVSRHVPIYEEKIQTKEEQTLVLKIENGDCRFHRLTEIAAERNERKVGNGNSIPKEVIYKEKNELFKQQEDKNPVEMEIVNSKLKLKIPNNQHDQPSKHQSKDINPPKTDSKIPKKEYGENSITEIKTRRNEKGANVNATGSRSNQETSLENGTVSDPLTLVLPLEKMELFIPKFGAHKIPSKHCRVKIMSVFDPYRMYVRIVDDDLGRLSLLSKQLQLQFQLLSRNALRKSAIKNPSQGCACAVLFGGIWQRGVVQSQVTPKTASQKVQVMIVDTGFSCQVPPLHIQPLHTIYLELPAQAVLCKLNGILRFELRDHGNQPMKNVDQYWPSPVIDLIQTKQDKMAEISVFNFVSGVVGSTPIRGEATLMVTMVVDGEPTSVNQQVDNTIVDAISAKNGYHTKKLVLQTVTNTTTKASCRRAKTNNKSNTSPVPKTHLATSTNPHGPNDIRVVAKTVSPSRSISNSFCQSSTITGHSDTSSQKKREVEQKSQALCTDTWTFADPKTILPHCFNGVVTWVDDTGGLYVHHCRWSKQLIVIRDTLNETLNRFNGVKVDLQCRPEDSCLAKYDSNWYRATIRAVNKEHKTVTVFLIDYGATVDVQRTDIRMDTILENIPARTFRCSLHNLMPLGSEEFDVGATWPATVINYFHATVVNQEFNMIIKCYSPLIIAMRFLKNSMDLTDFMVTARAGEYINQP